MRLTNLIPLFLVLTQVTEFFDIKYYFMINFVNAFFHKHNFQSCAIMNLYHKLIYVNRTCCAARYKRFL